ncbi:MAG: hypothetical protein ACRCYU_08625 [Nocardioides sp.]
MTHTWGIATSAAMILILLAGCGKSQGAATSGSTSKFADQSATEIRDQAVAATASVRSAHLAGTVTLDGARIKFSLLADTERTCVGRVVAGKGRAQIVSGPGGTFFQGDTEFWSYVAGGVKPGRRIATKLNKRWARVEVTQSNLVQICDFDAAIQRMVLAGENADWVKGDQGQVGGLEAIALTTEAEPKVTLWVATDAPHYIVKAAPEGSTGGSITLSEFNVAVIAEQPADDIVVPYAKLK